MSPEVREILEGVLQSAEQVRLFTKGLDLEGYRRDDRTRLAVERLFELIGEGLKRLGRVDPERLELIRNYRSVISFRNILAHAYDSVEDRIVWGIIEASLPDLIADVRALL